MSSESTPQPPPSSNTLEPHDRRILDALKDGPKTAQEIAALMPVGWRGIHGTELVLESLERAGLVRYCARTQVFEFL